MATTVSRYLCWYVGKSLLGTAAVNVAIICIFNIRRRENETDQILDLGEGDFSMTTPKRQSKEKKYQKDILTQYSYCFFQIRFFPNRKPVHGKLKMPFNLFFSFSQS